MNASRFAKNTPARPKGVNFFEIEKNISFHKKHWLVRFEFFGAVADALVGEFVDRLVGMDFALAVNRRDDATGDDRDGGDDEDPADRPGANLRLEGEDEADDEHDPGDDGHGPQREQGLAAEQREERPVKSARRGLVLLHDDGHAIGGGPNGRDGESR